MRQESSIRRNAKSIALLLFIGLIFADVIVAFYLIRERIEPALIAQNSRLFLPIIIHIPEPPAPTPEPATPAPEVSSYFVQEGDTLFGIALDHGLTLEELVKANQIENVDLINVGDTLIIPNPAEPQPTSEMSTPEATVEISTPDP